MIVQKCGDMVCFPFPNVIQTVKLSSKSEPINWTNMSVDPTGRYLAMTDDKGFIWMGSSSLRVHRLLCPYCQPFSSFTYIDNQPHAICNLCTPANIHSISHILHRIASVCLYIFMYSHPHTTHTHTHTPTHTHTFT